MTIGRRAGLLAAICAATAFAAPGAERFPESGKDSEPIRDEQYRQMDGYFERHIANAAANRARYWSRLDFSSAPAFGRSAEAYRNDWAAFLGVPSPAGIPLNVKRIKVREFERYTAYRVWFDTIPSVQAYGILLVPKAAGPKPALICVHGHAGSPEIAAGFLSDEELKDNIYRVFGRQAVERGYVVWCPMILGYYSEEREPKEGAGAQGRDILQKKAIITGRTLMGLEVAKIRRAVDFLETLPEVDPQRIGIYGLSKGGHYTLYTAALETRLRAAVVSGWFNDRAGKLLAPKNGPGMFFITYIHRDEYFLPDLLDRFGDAELAWMIAPRPLMVENGTRDGAVLIDDARAEFQRVEEVYQRLGAGERARFASFDGPHQIDGTQTFPFLDRWLGNTPPRP